MGPHIGDAEITWHVGFRLKASHDWTRLVVGFCDNTSSEYNSYGFVPMDTLELMQPGTWTEHHYTWTRPAGKSRLAFRMIRDMQDGDMRTVYIDDVRIEKCGIYNLRNYRTDAFGTYVEWTTCGTPVVSIGIRRSDRTNDSVVTAGTSPMHITGLEAGTRYVLSFYTQCGSEEGLIVGGNLVFSMPEEIPDAEYDLTFYSTLNNGRNAYLVDAAHPVVHALPRGEVFNMEYSCNNAVYTCHPPIRVYIPDSIYLPYCEPFYHENGQSGLPNGWSIFYTDTNCQPRLFFDWGELPLVVGCEANEWGRSQYTVMPPVATHGHLIIRATIHCNWDPERWIEIVTTAIDIDSLQQMSLGLWVYAEHPSDRLLVGTMTDPNGDGMNDRWVIVNLLEMGEYSMNELWIYDRFGALVYHVENIHRLSDFWDPNQTSSPDGTYYFRFSAKNNFGLVKRNGVIEVSR